MSNDLILAIERVAINPDVDVMKMEKLLDMKERVIDKNAEAAYSRAMCLCQNEMPTVVRDKVNAQTNSSYAKFETVLQTTKPCYTKHGFALSFGTEQSPVDGHVRVTCDIMHSEGHTKHKFADLPLDNAGIKGSINKTAMHATASTYSYGERYLFCMIFNVTIADTDTDGNLPGAPTVQGLLEHNAAVRDLFKSIATIKAAFEEKEYSVAVEAWSELTDDEKDSLWKAPSKGGMFTTEEISTFKSNEYSAARNEFFENKK